MSGSARLSWKVSDAVTVKTGTVTPTGLILGMSTNNGAGYVMTSLGGDYRLSFSGLTSYIDDPGLMVKYNLNPYMFVSVGLTSNESLYMGVYESTVDGLCGKCGVNYEGKGSGMFLDFFGMFSSDQG